MLEAKGEFKVALKPVSGEGEQPARMSIAKTFTGDLSGSSTGQMMMDAVEENGVRVYVALESFDGALNGRQGSFLLAHRGTMTAKAQHLSVIVVPGSGTGALIGISGDMDIDIRDGKHYYIFHYDLED
ncbi:MAG: DUF3224 domain-containing protein [Sphingomonadales bacterium]|nr:DUF3224 domain-containing protein [Sphingomonadales bacterium]